MDTNNEILDAIEILADKKIGDNITKVLTGICTSVNINKNTCVMDSNGVSGTVYFYGGPPEVNGLYRIFVPSNNMSRSFIVVPPKFTVNPNLLDNWYFVRPVNQRGQTKYAGSFVYTIDRWFLGGEPSNSMEITDGGIHVSYTTPGWNVIQKLKNVLCKGKTYTFSVVYKSTLPLRLVVTWGDNKYFYNEGSPATNEWALATITGTVPADAEIAYEQVIFQLLGSVAGTMDIKAAKLELGSTQTLAHLENGNWVLNEIPDYGEQLRKCQRYYQVHPAIYWLPQNADGTNRLTIPIPDMRAFPVVTYEPADGNTGTLYYDANLVQKDAIQFYATGVTGICGVKNIKLSADL